MAIFHIGDVVTVKSSVNGNYSNYGPNKGKEILFSQGMTGTIVSDKLPSVWRRGFSFYCVDFFCNVTNKIERAGVIPNNLEKIKE